MRKILILFLVFCSFGFVYMLYENDYFYYSTFISNEEFVSVEEGKFMLEGKPFYPVAINYIASLHYSDGIMWPSPYKGYYSSKNYKYTSRDSTLMELEAEMRLIKSIGFNTVRITGIGEQFVADRSLGVFSIGASLGNEKDTVFVFDDDSNYEMYYNALSDVYNIADKLGLKIILLTKYFNEVPNMSAYIKKMARHFNDRTALMAYDLYNEPLYFDSLPRKKKEVYELTKKWAKLMKRNAPHQLYTIGLTGIREVFEWDPNVVNADFLSMHPYEYEMNQVNNELYWYHKYIKKPWIIGETSLPADNDSVPYEDQRKFATQTLLQTYNCGGAGYSWWQYKDVEWIEFHPSFMGVVKRFGTTMVNNSYEVEGTLKPVAESFRNYNPGSDKGNCICYPNYHNYTDFKDYKIVGKLANEDGEPIGGGVVIAWDESWQYSFHGVSKEDGSFEITSKFPFYHWKASATLHDVWSGDVDVTATITFDDNRKGVNLGTIILPRLNL